jgi:3-isopropylmalate dehydratase small subunit
MTIMSNKYSLTVRKGPRKYYSLVREDLESDDTYFLTVNPELARSQVEYKEMLTRHSLRNYTFAPVYQSLKEGHQVDVYRSTYTIGEHAQISWLDSEMTWIIASQHASVFVRNLEDLQLYK